MDIPLQNKEIWRFQFYFFKIHCKEISVVSVQIYKAENAKPNPKIKIGKYQCLLAKEVIYTVINLVTHLGHVRKITFGTSQYSSQITKNGFLTYI